MNCMSDSVIVISYFFKCCGRTAVEKVNERFALVNVHERIAQFQRYAQILTLEVWSYIPGVNAPFRGSTP